jgi:hypothetical protein
VVIALAVSALALAGVIALIPLGWRACDEPGDVRLVEVAARRFAGAPNSWR